MPNKLIIAEKHQFCVIARKRSDRSNLKKRLLRPFGARNDTFPVLTKLDKLILKEFQDNFPIVSRPYALAAEKFNLTEDELIRKVKDLKKRKLIRYIGATFENKKLGISSALVAMSVPEKDIRRVAKIINSYPQVSHNYLRAGEFNMWFTLSAPSVSLLAKLLKQIKQRAGVTKVLNLETVRVFKIDARFKV